MMEPKNFVANLCLGSCQTKVSLGEVFRCVEKKCFVLVDDKSCISEIFSATFGYSK